MVFTKLNHAVHPLSDGHLDLRHLQLIPGDSYVVCRVISHIIAFRTHLKLFLHCVCPITPHLRHASLIPLPHYFRTLSLRVCTSHSLCFTQCGLLAVYAIRRVLIILSKQASILLQILLVRFTTSHPCCTTTHHTHSDSHASCVHILCMRCTDASRTRLCKSLPPDSETMFARTNFLGQTSGFCTVRLVCVHELRYHIRLHPSMAIH